MQPKLSVIILAAGKGTRMKSILPKVLHPLAGKPMLSHVYDTSRALSANEIVIVYGHGGELLPKECEAFEASWVEQKEQLGTGHAVEHALREACKENLALVLYGDVPLITAASLQKLIQKIDNTKLGLMTFYPQTPKGYGRIVRNGVGEVVKIVEEKDADDCIRQINEVNTGILAANAGVLESLLEKVENNNVQKEFYLTDVVGLAVDAGLDIVTTQPDFGYEVEGVNDRIQLARLERIYQVNVADALMKNGATIIDPARIDIRGSLTIGQDVLIDINTVFEGHVHLENGVRVGAGCVIKDSRIGENSVIKPYSVVEEAAIERGVEVGPFARVRPGTHLQNGSRIGNFVETKKASIGEGSKVNHLSYIGDSEVGKNVNIGAGTITCNYDGANKHKTIIEDGVFVGSDTQLVAPVVVGRNATIGAGSTITRDVEAEVLALSRTNQKSVAGWKRPTKK